ncbi:hypothetical protein NOC27_1245 [Nitrosococcus oceani AFC27]|nr:hypothetical protein NOC27_1245 [Nitrosococcus oceani AFC27]
MISAGLALSDAVFIVVCYSYRIYSIKGPKESPGAADNFRFHSKQFLSIGT